MASKAHVAVDKSFTDENKSDCSSDNESNPDATDGSGSEASHSSMETSLHSKEGGMANAMAKILGKKVPRQKSAILAKGKTDKEIKKRQLQREKEEENKTDDSKKNKENDNTDKKDSGAVGCEKKKIWEEMGRLKPDALDKVNERKLQRIATRGVVQLFNAVRQQQKLLDEKLSEVSSERRKERVIESMTKRKFMDILKGGPVNVSTEDVPVKSAKKFKEIESEKDKTTWSILQDDFMMGATMKDWDKQVSGDEACDRSGIDM